MGRAHGSTCSTSPEDAHPKELSRWNGSLCFVDYAKSAVCQLPPQPERVDKRKVVFELQHRRKFTNTNRLLHFATQLKDYRERAVGFDQRHGVLKATIDASVFEDQCCVNQ